MPEINDRISQIRLHFCEKNNQFFAEKIGKSDKYASMLCSGGTIPGRKMLDHILETFPEVSRSWLILGEGEMLSADNAPANHITQTANGAANAINSTGSHNTNTINTNDSTALINEIIKGKDEQIKTLKETIAALTGEVEQLRNYVSLTSSKYINVIERMLYTTTETNDIIKECRDRIGFRQDECCGKK